MKINKSQLKEIIKEEIEQTLSESEPVVKIPVSKMDDFKRRLEKWAMHYEKLSSWIANDAILAPDDEQLENPNQLSRITRQDGMKMRKQLYKLDNILATLMDDYEMQFKRYQDVRYDALKALELDESKLSEVIEEGEDFLGDVKSTGEWTDYTISQLKKKKDALMKKEKRTADEVKTVRQLNFAINAKQGDYKEKK